MLTNGQKKSRLGMETRPAKSKEIYATRHLINRATDVNSKYNVIGWL